MASSISRIFNRLNSTLQKTNSQSFQSLVEHVFSHRSYTTEMPMPTKDNLYSRISPLGDSSLSLVPVLDNWVEEGKKLKYPELQRIVKDLRRRKRFSQALEVSEWMSSRELCPFSQGDRAVQLDLIGRVRGLDAAERYFNNINDQEKIDKIYGALLYCYVREGLVDKALSHRQVMKEMGFSSSPLTYNDLMCLYTNTGQLDKVPDVLLEMKSDGVSPDNFSYRLCINSYGERSDLNSMEEVLKEMESQPRISMDWNTYAVVANFYIKAGLKEKALILMKKSEEKIQKDANGYNHLISLYAALRNKQQMFRLWDLLKANCRKQINKDYITILGCLVKIGELEEAEKLLVEWESSGLCYDFRVPNILLIGYSQKGLIEKAEATLREMVNKGKTPTPNSWGILANGFVDKQDMKKAMECMKEAFAVLEENKKWRPKPKVISSILNWLDDNDRVEEMEAFVSSLMTAFPTDDEILSLINGFREGKEVEGLSDNA